MCDERTDHTGLCRPLLSNLHSFTPYCDIGPASEDISCSVRPLRCFSFVPSPCSGFPFEILLTETLLQGTFRTGQGRSRHLVDLPGSCLGAFLLVVTEPTRNGGRTPKGHKPYTIQVVGRILEIRQLVIVLRDLTMIEEAMAQHSG